MSVNDLHVGDKIWCSGADGADELCICDEDCEIVRKVKSNVKNYD